MVFFTASLFFTERTTHELHISKNVQSLLKGYARLRSYFVSPYWATILITGLSIVLLIGFLFTRYGNERQDAMTYAEVAGVQHLYDIAQPGSIFIEGTNGTPWQFQDYEKYNTYPLTDSLLTAIANRDTAAITRFIHSKKHTNAYVIFTRSQKFTLESSFGLPFNTLENLEKALIASGNAKLIYSNSDVHILLFLNGTTQGEA
jgi:hypothetical protein